MSLYAIGDLHLSLSTDKSMEVFGPAWKNYIEKIRLGFSALDPDDVCVICGDISWGMSLDEAREDLGFVDQLPGRKILLKGNHDYWWSSGTKMKAFFEENDFTTLQILHNNSFPYGDDIAICGTKGWFYEESRGSSHDKKLIDREAMRLEMSLQSGGTREKYVFLHYPPRYGTYLCTEILSLLKKYDVKICASGHLHAESLRFAFEGWHDHTRHLCVSGDKLDFKPCKIL